MRSRRRALAAGRQEAIASVRPNDDGKRRERSVRVLGASGSGVFPKAAVLCPILLHVRRRFRKRTTAAFHDFPDGGSPFLSNAGPIEIAPRFVLPRPLRRAVATTSRYEEAGLPPGDFG
jgi:hypothetical protein